LKKQHTQQIKDRATILQTHLKRRGVELPRTEALNLLSQMDGYRSFNAAHHGRPQEQGVFANARRKYRTLNDGYSREVVVEDYLVDGGQHCPQCGSAGVVDNHESYADHRHWEILVRCTACDDEWWAVYELVERDGFGLDTPRAKQALLNAACPYCHDTELDYGSFTAAPGRSYQSAVCTKCRGSWLDIYRLVDAAETEEMN
jgi:transposase-like protein